MSGPFPLPTSSLKTLFPGLVSRRRNLSWRSVQIGRWWSVQIGPRALAGSLSLNDIMKWEELPATRPPSNESHETASVSGACEGSEPGGKGGRGGGDLHSGREGDFNPSAPPPLSLSPCQRPPPVCPNLRGFPSLILPLLAAPLLALSYPGAGKGPLYKWPLIKVGKKNSFYRPFF